MSVKHNGENWPYHEDPNGNMVPCKSNPCSRHSQSEHTIATSPEEAYARHYANNVGMSTAMSAPVKFKHDRMPRKKFTRLRKAAMSFFTITLVTASLSACSGAYNDYNSDSVQSPDSSSSSSTQYDYEDLHKSASELYGKAKDAYNSEDGQYLRGKAKEYGGKAKEGISAALSDLDDYLSEDDANSTQPTTSGDVPAALAAHTDVGMSALDSLTVVPDHGNRADYNRKDYGDGQWPTAPGASQSCWSVRDEVIKRQADPGTLKLTSDGCAVASVTMTDPYTGKKLTANNANDVSTKIQIDHVVPVSYADSNGGSSWSQDVKDAYYSDMDMGHLIATSTHQNRDLKGDKGPGEYMLDSNAPLSYKAAYAQDWVSIIKKYNANGGSMTIEQSDYNAIKSIFQQAGIQ